MTYYPNGLLKQSVTDPGKTKAVTTNYTYDFANHIYSVEVSATGLETRTSSVKYDNKNRFAIKQTNSLGHFTEATYDEVLGVVKTSKDINGLESTFTYDAFGRQTESLGPDGTHAVNTMAWCNGTPSGALYYSQTATTGSPTVKTYFDFLGRAIKSEAPGFDGRMIVAEQIYNKLGQLYKSSEPYFQGGTKRWTTNTYDSYGRLARTQAPNSTITNTYSDKTVSTTNTTTGQTMSKTLNSLGQLVSATDQGGTIAYTYFPSGKPKTIVTNGITTSMGYDEYGNQTSLTDPNTGTTNYDYNAYGELISQTDSKGDTYTLTYDKLGRVLTKTGPEGTTSYKYDTETNGIGALASVLGPNGTSMSYQYDNLGRPKNETQVVDAASYTTGISYTGNKLSNITYPSGFGVNYAYNSLGYLEEIKRADNSNSIWKAEQYNALGQIEKFLFGNGLRTTKTYDAAHFLKTVQTTNSGGTFLQNMEYDFNAANGNLLSRKNKRYNLTENFEYDQLDRLTQATVTGQAAIKIAYQPSGNIDTKSGIGTYTYGDNAGPHALTNIENTGGIVSPLDQDITYTAFNKVETITENNTVAVFKYGPDQERRKMTIEGSGTTITRIYIGNYEKEVNNGNTRELHYIGAGGEIVAIYEKTGTSGAMFYVHPDHLGSLNVVTNEEGSIVEEQSFDAWGRRRNPQNWTYNNVPAAYKFYRGYTGHEQLDQFGLINMNGRMYDPSVGRFLSPDIVVQAPDFTQSYNRYSYCFNNPLKYTDPSGWTASSAEEEIRDMLDDYYRLYAEWMGRQYGADGLTNEQWINASGPGADLSLAGQYRWQNRIAYTNAMTATVNYGIIYQGVVDGKVIRTTYGLVRSEIRIIIHYQNSMKGWEKYQYSYVNNRENLPNNDFVIQTVRSLDFLISNNIGTDVLKDINSLPLGFVVNIQPTENGLVLKDRSYTQFDQKAGNTIFYDPYQGLYVGNDIASMTGLIPPVIGLLHELAHYRSSILSPDRFSSSDYNYQFWNLKWTNPEEKWVIQNVEWSACNKLGFPIRYQHSGGVLVNVNSPLIGCFN